MSDDAGSNLKVPTALEQLAEQFPTSAHKKVKKGGGEQTYIPWTDAVDRLNTVLGAGWSFRIVREGMTPTEAWALGEIRATINGLVTVRQQYGCEPITMGQCETPTGDLFKKAGTDALHKAATLLGVGLYLSVHEERAEVEAAMRAEVQAEAKRQADERLRAAARAREATKAPSTPAPTPITDKVRDAAMVTGANPDALICAGCMTGVDPDGTVDIARNKEGARAKVTVSSFAPVCRERLGGFYCGPCYDKRYWKAQAS